MARNGIAGLLRQHAWSLGTFVGIIVAWEILVWALRIPAFVLPRPSRVALLLLDRWELFGRHLAYSAQEILLGFAASVAIGVPLAIGIVYSGIVERISYAIIVPFQAIPKTALAPLLILWFGYGLASKVAVAFLIAFFPIVVNTVIGMRSVEPEMLHLSRSLGARPWQTFLKIRLPKALPSMFGGFKVAVALAVVGTIVGEYIGANAGLGYIQLVASANLDTPMVFGVIIILSLLGLALFGLVGVLERMVIRWKPGEAQLEPGRETI